MSPACRYFSPFCFLPSFPSPPTFPLVSAFFNHFSSRPSFPFRPPSLPSDLLMEDMERTSVLDIPELVSIVASWLSAHDLTICVRVNSTWAENLRPFLYENIKVVDFDLYSHRTRRAMRFPPPDLWRAADRQTVGETRSKEMNLLDFKMFQGQDGTGLIQEGTAKNGQLQPQPQPRKPREQKRPQESAKDSVKLTPAQTQQPNDSGESTATITTTGKDDQKDLPKLLFPNLLQSPLTLDANLMRPAGSYSKAAEMFRRPVGYGGQHVHKYGQFIRTLTVAHPHSLIYVGKHCSHLRELSVYNWMSLDSSCRYQLGPKFTECWQNFWRSRNQEKMLRIWIQVLERNPRLQVVRLELDLIPLGGLTRLAMVLAKLEHLQEIEVFDAGVDRRVEVILDHCQAINKFSWTTIEGKSKVALGGTYSERQKQNASLFGRTRICRGYMKEQPPCTEELGGNRRPTGIQNLDLTGLTMQMPLANIKRFLARMPQLKCLRGPKCYQTQRVLSVVFDAEKTHLCPLLERLELTSTRKGDVISIPILISRFRNCANFTSLQLFNLPGECGESRYIDAMEVRQRLLEYEEHSRVLSFPSRWMQLNVTRECVNLRILDLESRPMSVLEYLSLQWSCQGSLVKLRISICCDAQTVYNLKPLPSPSSSTCPSPSSSSSESDLQATELPSVESAAKTSEHERVAVQKRVFDHMLPLVRLEKLHLCKGMWNEKLPSFPFIMDQEATKQLRRLRLLEELLVYNERHILA